MSTISLTASAPLRVPAVRLPSAGRRASGPTSSRAPRPVVGTARPARRRPGGAQPPRVSFVEQVAPRGCWSQTPPAVVPLAGAWHLTSRGVAVVVSLTATTLSLALVAMVVRFLAVTAA